MSRTSTSTTHPSPSLHTASESSPAHCIRIEPSRLNLVVSIPARDTQSRHGRSFDGTCLALGAEYRMTHCVGPSRLRSEQGAGDYVLTPDHRVRWAQPGRRGRRTQVTVTSPRVSQGVTATRSPAAPRPRGLRARRANRRSHDKAGRCRLVPGHRDSGSRGATISATVTPAVGAQQFLVTPTPNLLLP